MADNTMAGIAWNEGNADGRRKNGWRRGSGTVFTVCVRAELCHVRARSLVSERECRYS